jgi:hypothetical protein
MTKAAESLRARGNLPPSRRPCAWRHDFISIKKIKAIYSTRTQITYVAGRHIWLILDSIVFPSIRSLVCYIDFGTVVTAVTVQIFVLLLQNFALLFSINYVEINCTEIYLFI